MIVEWIPYDKFINLQFLAKGGCSDIYTADWEEGGYKEWDIKERKLKRAGKCKVVLKKLENVEDADRTWLEEATTHLFISNKWVKALCRIHEEKSVHRDLHSGNILYSKERNDCNSKLYTFHDVPQPKNATEEEQDAYYTSQFNLHISDFPDDI
ncbi:unnamed protein product [Rhizophagus irregularis]|nr:unnamed protein product [Rhizophagus irregularis]